jgi:predicted nucleic acid-binding protein
MRIYLDNCCFNRPFDDQKQIRIRLETEAKLEIQERILLGEIELAWSYILDFENEMNPFEQRKIAIRQWKYHATVDTVELKEIIDLAKKFHEMGLKSKDSLHIACAISLKCNYFLTTDDELIKKAMVINAIKITDPISYIRE